MVKIKRDYVIINSKKRLDLIDYRGYSKNCEKYYF